MDIKVIRKCLACGKAAGLRCRRCLDPYCSDTCQLIDWQDHKPYCIQMPGLVSVSEPMLPKSDDRSSDFKIKETVGDQHHENSRPVFKNKYIQIDRDMEIKPLRRPHHVQNIEKDKVMPPCSIANNSPTVSLIEDMKLSKNFGSLSVLSGGSDSSISSKKSESNKELTIKADNLKLGFENKPWQFHSSIDSYKGSNKAVSVEVQYIGNDTKFWIILENNIEEFQIFFEKLNKTYKNEEFAAKLRLNAELLASISIGDCYIVLMADDRKFYRVMIIEAPKFMRMSVKIRFIDFGEETLVSLGDLYQCVDDFKYSNAYALCVQFEDTGLLKNIKCHNPLRVLFLPNDTLPVNQPGIASVATVPQKIDLFVEKNKELSLESDILTVKNLPRLKLKTGKNIKLMVLDSSSIDEGVVTVAEYNIENLKFFKNICSAVGVYAKTQQSKGYKPEVNELCLAIFADDQNWYRAVCLKHSSNDTYFLEFIDFGNKQYVPSSKIIPINKEFASLDYRSNKAEIDGFPQFISKEKLIALTSKLSDQILIAESIVETTADRYKLVIDGFSF